MALLSDLVRAIAMVEGIDEVSVGIYARRAREVGLIAQGGRGRSAAKMSSSDAANLLIAVNACAYAKDVPSHVPRYRSLVLTEDTADYLRHFTSADVENDDFWSAILRKGLSFGEALEALVDVCTPDGDQPPALITSGNGPNRVSLQVQFGRPHPEVRIFGEDAPGTGKSFWGEELRQPVIHARFTSSSLSPVGVGDRRDRASITASTLLAVGQALAA